MLRISSSRMQAYYEFRMYFYDRSNIYLFTLKTTYIIQNKIRCILNKCRLPNKFVKLH